MTTGKKKIKNYDPSVCPFKKSDMVEINGSIYKGLAEVLAVMLAWPKGEASYSWSYSLPLPQMLIRTRSGETLRLDGKDLFEGMAKATQAAIPEPQTLETILKKVVVDSSQAYADLGEDPDEDGSKKSLFQSCKSILPFLKPLLDQKVFFGGVEDGDDVESVELGEFDSHTFHFRSVKTGRAMRNSGQAGFELSIKVDGYAPTTFELKVSESYWWGKEE